MKAFAGDSAIKIGDALIDLLEKLVELGDRFLSPDIGVRVVSSSRIRGSPRRARDHVTYETIRPWYATLGLAYARGLRRRRGRQGDTGHLDELFVWIHGRQQYLWRAIDEDGDVLDISVQPRRNRRAALRFLRKLLKGQGAIPRRLITDKLVSYRSAHGILMPAVRHRTDRYANNRAEVSHEATRQRERQMRGFKSVAHLQRFASIHSAIQNLFRLRRYLLRAAHYRVLRTRGMSSTSPSLSTARQRCCR